MDLAGTTTRFVVAVLVLSVAGAVQASQAIAVLNGDFELPTWVQSGSSWSLQSVSAGGLSPNYNSQDPRFGIQGWGKTAVNADINSSENLMNGFGENGEGAYGEQNNSTTPAGKYYNYVNGSLLPSASGQQFLSPEVPGFNSSHTPTYNATYSGNWINNGAWNGTSVNGYKYQYTSGTSELPMMYNFWTDEQPDITSPLLHTDVNYPPLIPLATTIAGHTYTATVSLGNPLWNQANGNTAFPVVELDLTTGANSNQGFYNGYGTTAAQAIANGSSDPNWQIAPGTFKDLTVTWTAPTSGLSLDILLTVTGFTETPGTAAPNRVSMDNVRLVDLTATPEPATLTLLATGLIGTLAYAWRRSRS